MRDKVFKNGTSKIRGRQPLKNLKWYGLLNQAVFGKFHLVHYRILCPIFNMVKNPDTCQVLFSFIKTETQLPGQLFWPNYYHLPNITNKNQLNEIGKWMNSSNNFGLPTKEIWVSHYVWLGVRRFTWFVIANAILKKEVG